MTSEQQRARTARLVAFYQARRRLIEWTYWPLVKLTGALLAAGSVVMEYERRGLSVGTWEPYAWELTSALSALLCIWLIIRFDRRFPLDSDRVGQHVLAHAGFTVAISLIHVGVMVSLRELIYRAMGGHYDFGNWSSELWYEYRKDASSYVTILTTLYVYRFVSSRLINEASAIDEGEETSSRSFADRFLVRKLGRDFLLRADQIDWIEAAGNYMNLHANGRTYPLRQTMAGLERSLDPERFARVHRSFIVNLDRVISMTPQDSGDALIRLSDGADVRLSRRYREAFVARAGGQ